MALFSRAVIVLALLTCVIFISQSCGDKPNDDVDDIEEKPDRPPWLQMEIDWFASWSPDGSKIIYMREKAGSGRDTSWTYGAFIHDFDSDKDTCIWPSVKFDGFSWAPDGRRVAVVQAGQVFIYDFDTDSLRQITNRYRSYSVSWSPCGDKIVFFDRFNYVGMQIYDLALDSVISVESEDQTLAGDWAPNCSTIIVLDTCRYEECNIYGYNYYADSLWLITRVYGYKTDLAVSPDGQAVVFGLEHDLWIVDITTQQRVQLTTEGGRYPDWSPDGQWIVYTKMNWWNGWLWIMRPDGSEKHQITF